MFDLALNVPKFATVAHFALPEGCCWRLLIWTWVLESPQLSSRRAVLLEVVYLDLGAGIFTTVVSQRGAVGGC